MKTFRTIMIILAALLAIAGALYVVVAYGDKIIAWCKTQLHRINSFFNRNGYCFEEDDLDMPAYASDFAKE